MKIQSVKQTYEDIINLPHPVFEKHPPMSRSNRAAQFAPFAALTGLEQQIENAAKETEQQYEENTNPFSEDFYSQEIPFESKEINTSFLHE